MQNLPEETVYQNITEGLSIIKNQRAILHVQYGTFLGFFRENPTFNQNIKVFGKGRAEYSSLIVNRNSPLKPILQQGTVFENPSKKFHFTNIINVALKSRTRIHTIFGAKIEMRHFWLFSNIVRKASLN